MGTWTFRVSFEGKHGVYNLRTCKGWMYLGSLAEVLGILYAVPIGSLVVPFRGLYLGSYKVIPKSNY